MLNHGFCGVHWVRFGILIILCVQELVWFELRIDCTVGQVCAQVSMQVCTADVHLLSVYNQLSVNARHPALS